MESLQRTKSDISSVLLYAKEISTTTTTTTSTDPLVGLPAVSEVELAKCECCGMSEECSAEYMDEMRKKNSGKLLCGLCAEAVKEEMEKNNSNNGGTKKTREEAVQVHMNACARFNRLGRAYPSLYQADAVKKLLKKSTAKGAAPPSRKASGLARSSSCMPAIVKDMQDKLTV